MKNSGDRCGRRVLVAGLGNCLLMDDGVGVHAVRALQKRSPENRMAQEVVLAEIGTAILDALHLLEEADIVIALDAIQAGHPPGTIVEIANVAAMNPRAPDGSIHELGLRQAIRMLPEEHRPELYILGVEPARIDFGDALSDIVAEALPGLVTTVEERLKSILPAP